MKKFILFVIVFSCFCSVIVSQVVKDCRETRVKYEKSLEYNTLSPVTIDEMSDILKNDKNVKIVIQYSACDSKNIKYIKDVVLPYWRQQDQSKVSLYLIALDCGYLKGIEQFFVENDIDIKRYYYRDNTPQFCMHSKEINENRDKDIQKSHFMNADLFSDFSSNNFKWFIVDANNNVKLVEYVGVDFNGKEHMQLMPMMIESMPQNILSLDFSSKEECVLPEKSLLSETIKIIWSAQ